jgi:hypothetical protein
MNTRVVKLSPLNKNEDAAAVNDGQVKRGIADGEMNTGENAVQK